MQRFVWIIAALTVIALWAVRQGELRPDESLHAPRPALVATSAVRG